MNTSEQSHIYRRENLSYDESSRIQRESGNRDHKSFDQHQKEFIEKQKLQEDLSNHKCLEDQRPDRETAQNFTS